MRLNPASPMFWIMVIRPYAVPSLEWSTMRATEGHMMAGISEKAMPMMTIGIAMFGK